VASVDPALSLHRRFLTAWVGIATLIVLDQALIQPELTRMASDAPVINISGRQRMLSQKLTKTALVIAQETDPRVQRARQRELADVLELWTRSHQGLQSGAVEWKLPGRNSVVVVSALAALKPDFDAIQAAASDLVSHAGAAPEAPALVRTILDHEPRYLDQMNAIVGLYEAEARQRVVWLERTGWTIAAAILTTMAGLAWFAIRPAASRLAAQYRQSQRQCATLADQLAHADRLKSVGEIAAGIAHEVNQPLGAIANYAEGALARIASGAAVAEDLVSPLQRMLAAALKAGQVIRRVKRFAQHRPHIVQTTAVNSLVRDVLDLFEPELNTRSIHVAEQFADPSPELTCDALQISQVLTNLIQNAIRAVSITEVGERWLTLITAGDDEMVTITVRDTGPGVAPEMLARLFQPFSTDHPEGLGMGLSIVRSIVEGHGGTISGGNGDYGGAVFTVRLLIQPATEAAILTEAGHA
jgi:two-component system sensor kinase FixL